jgi:purine nucleoside phosphorylase
VNEAAQAARVLAARASERVRVGIVLGSGLGEVADAVQEPVLVGYEELPGFPAPTVAGHAARTCTRAGRSTPCGRRCERSAAPVRRSSC